MVELRTVVFVRWFKQVRGQLRGAADNIQKCVPAKAANQLVTTSPLIEGRLREIQTSVTRELNGGNNEEAVDGSFDAVAFCN